MKLLKKGDWCFCEFKLQKITKTKGNRITEVSDGICCLSSNDLTDRCFPMDMEIKLISDNVLYNFKRIQYLNDCDVNTCGIYKLYISKWIEICKYKDNYDVMNDLLNKLSTLTDNINDKISEKSKEKIEGINLFR